MGGLAALPGVAAPRPAPVELAVQARGGVVTAVRGIHFRCSGSCVVRVRRGAVAELAAAPDATHSFVRWTGACVGTAARCLVVVDAPVTIRAVFAAATAKGVAGPSAAPSPAATTTGSAADPAAAAPPPKGRKPHVRVAEIDVTVSGPGRVTGGGRSRISCAGANLLSGGCHRSFRVGTVVVLRAWAHVPHRFFSWGAVRCTTRPRCKLRVTRTMLVLAAFRR